MKMHTNWKTIAKKAWSCRLMILAGVLSGAEAVLPLFQESIPQGVFAALTMIAISAAFVSRLVAQQEVDDE